MPDRDSIAMEALVRTGLNSDLLYLNLAKVPVPMSRSFRVYGKLEVCLKLCPLFQIGPGCEMLCNIHVYSNTL